MEEFRFKKKFGQNFLTDKNLLEAIVRDAGVDEESTVLEIGTGAGALTKALAEKAKRVISFEIDPTLRPVLSETLKGYENVEVRFADFLRIDLPALEEEIGEYVVVANLPYYITTAVLLRFLEEANMCRGVTVMVQEEVATRLCASAGTADYGAITAAIALKGEAVLTRKVPRTMFTPRPNVDSAVVHIPFTGGLDVDPKAYRAVVKCAFSSRRKTLENNLMACFSLPRERAKEILSEAEIQEGVRGETLTPPMFAVLAEVCSRRKVL